VERKRLVIDANIPIRGCHGVRVRALIADYADRVDIFVAEVPGVNYVGGSRQLRWRVGAPNPLPWQGVGPRRAWARLAGN